MTSIALILIGRTPCLKYSTKRYRQHKRSLKIAAEREDCLKSIPKGNKNFRAGKFKGWNCACILIATVTDTTAESCGGLSCARSHHKRPGIGIDEGWGRFTFGILQTKPSWWHDSTLPRFDLILVPSSTPFNPQSIPHSLRVIILQSRVNL